MKRKKVEKRKLNKFEWSPYTSKWKAALENEMRVELGGKENILYLGASSGTTIGHLSKLTEGIIFGVEKSPHMMIKLIRLAEARKNIAPIFCDARDSEMIREKLFGENINVLFQDIPSRDQINILVRASQLVNKKCKIFLSLKTQSINQKNWEETGKKILKDLEKNFEVMDMKSIEPYHQKHYFIILKKK